MNFGSREKGILEDQELDCDFGYGDILNSDVEGKSICHPALVARQTHSALQLAIIRPRYIVEILCGLLS